MINDLKFVHYNDYCKTCEHYEEDEASDACNECLNNPVNVNSHKPVNYKEKSQNEQTS